MNVNFKELSLLLTAVTKSRKPVLIRGRHGIGKSEMVRAFAESVGMEMVERRASQMSEGDLAGLPKIVKGVTKFNPPDWFSECCKTPRVLFLDELDRATKEVRQGFFELADSRKIYGNTLHPETLVFAAINGGNEDNIDYLVYEMGPAELDRWTIFDLNPTCVEWIQWAKNNDVHEYVIKFISKKTKFLEMTGGNIQQNVIQPSRRSWKRFSDCLLINPELVKNQSLLMKCCYSFVGEEAALGFSEFISTLGQKLTVEDIVFGGFFKTIRELTQPEHLELVGDISLLDSKTLTKDVHWENLWRYLNSLGGELYIKFAQLSLKDNKKLIDDLTKHTKEECVIKLQNFLSRDSDSFLFDSDNNALKKDSKDSSSIEVAV